MLAFPNFSNTFILDTDASDTGIGAALSQLDDNNQEYVIAYLNKPERQYMTGFEKSRLRRTKIEIDFFGLICLV